MSKIRAFNANQSLKDNYLYNILYFRALYRNADICLMDDPLSAVDSAVAEHIFEKFVFNTVFDVNL